MFLSRVELGARAAESPSFWREVSTPYGAHQALWRLFKHAPEQRRDFLYRQELGARGLQFFVLSALRPTEGEPLWQVETRSFAPVLRPGQQLMFRLRASPVVRRRSLLPSGGGRSKRHDVAMDLKRSQRESGGPVDAPQKLAELGGLKWLSAQSNRSGFRLATSEHEQIGEDGMLEAANGTKMAVRVDGYQQHRLRRPGQNDSNDDIRFSTVDFEGRIEVVDPVLMLDRIRGGLGPQKAFGCGLMLLRRV